MKWIEIFSSGTHTSNAGNQITYTDHDLVNMADMYNTQSDHEAPIVIGHPQTDHPAYGWVDKLRVEGNKLLAMFKDVQPEFIDMVKRGLYKKISISHYPNKLLKHVGFLGAVPPAVKGLASAKFNSNEEAIEFTVDFADEYSKTKQPNLPTNTGDPMLDKIIADFIEWLRSTVNNEEIVNKALSKLNELTQSMKQAQQPPQPQAPVAAGMAMLPPQQPRAFSETPEYAEMMNRLTQEQETNKALLARLEESEFSEVFDEAVRAGKAIPAQRSMYRLNYSMLPTSISFSENDKEVNYSKKDYLKKMFDTQPSNNLHQNLDNRSEDFSEDDMLTKHVEHYNGKI